MNPDSDTLLQEALRLKREKRHEEAWQLFQVLAEDFEDSSFFHANRAHLALLVGRPEEGADFAGEALRLRPDNTFARSIFARLLSELGRDEDALEQLRLRLEQEFDRFDFKRLVQFCANAGELETAERVFVQWQPLRKDDPDFFLAMAEGYRKLGRKQKAAELYARVLELEPDHAFAQQQALAVKLEETDSAAGVRELELMLRLPENQNSVHLLNLLARALKKEGRYEEAAEAFRKLLALEPDNRYYQKQLGFVCSKWGNYRAVVQLLTPCFEEDPDDVYVSRTLLAAMRRTGQKTEALRLMDRMIARHPKPGRFYGLKKQISRWPPGMKY